MLFSFLLVSALIYTAGMHFIFQILQILLFEKGEKEET